MKERFSRSQSIGKNVLLKESSLCLDDSGMWCLEGIASCFRVLCERGNTKEAARQRTKRNEDEDQIKRASRSVASVAVTAMMLPNCQTLQFDPKSQVRVAGD